MDLKSCKTIEGCVEMVIPWQFCRTIGPLLSQRFLLASAKAQLRGGFFPTRGVTASKLFFLTKVYNKGVYNFDSFSGILGGWKL